MKKLIFTLFFFSAFSLFAQEPLEWIDPFDELDQAVLLNQNEEFEKALETLENIHPNDSVYADALIAKSLAYLGLENYPKTIETCEEEMEYGHYYTPAINRSVALLRSEDYKNAEPVLLELLDKYPGSYAINYNLAVVYEKLEKHALAVTYLKKTIQLNPYIDDPHVNLALLCYKEGLTAQTMLCLNAAIILTPSEDRKLQLLEFLNQLVSTKNNSEPNGIQISKDDEGFEELNLIINSYAALNKKYKIPNKIDLPLVRQNHALLSKLGEFEGGGDFFEKIYVPYFKAIYDEGYFDHFTYWLMSGSTNPKYKSIVEKNATKLSTFLSWTIDTWVEGISKNNDAASKDGSRKYWYQNSGNLATIGNVDDAEEPFGEWEFYHDNGNIAAKGKFDAGKQTGKWVYFRDDGTQKSEENYANDELEGPFKTFFDNGQVRDLTQYIAGEPNGDYKRYNKLGALIETAIYVKGEFDGETVLNYAMGEGFPEYKLNYTEGKRQGVSTQFFKNGQIMKKVNYVDDLAQGAETHYYIDGQIYQEFSNEAGKATGVNKKYHRNGKLMEEGSFAEGYPTGPWKSYYRDGTLESTYTYDDKGRLEGISLDYDTDGTLASEFLFKKGEVIAYKYFDKEGKVIKEAKKQKGKFMFEGFLPDGTPSQSGLYLLNGGQDGVWRKFTKYGNLTSEKTYIDGKLDGDFVSYHPNGEIASLTPYKDGVRDGLYKAYHTTGELWQQGFYKEGMAERFWESYFPGGSLKERAFYLHDDAHGMQEYYSVEGFLDYVEEYDQGELQKVTYYCKDNTVLNEIDFASTAGPYDLMYCNGKLMRTSPHKNGISHGKYIWYHENDAVWTEGEVFYKKYNGQWDWFFPDGTPMRSGKYDFGYKNGTWTRYHENGKVSGTEIFKNDEQVGLEESFNEEGFKTFEGNYKNGEQHGAIKYFSQKGKLQLIRYYHEGKLIGYSYPGKDGKPVPMIEIKNGTGKIKSYYPDGSVSRELEFINGKFTGVYKKYHENGQLSHSQDHVNGDAHGELKDYYENGQLKKTGGYANDEPHGPFVEYYANGKLKEKLTYIHGERSGEAEYYDNTGKMTRKVVYYNGEILSEEKF